MRRLRARPILPAFALAGIASAALGAASPAPPAPPAIVHAPQDEAVAAALAADLAAGHERVERFFGRPFPKPFAVEVFPDRAGFDAYFKTRWGLPATESWMVATGVADKLAILSPRVWKTEAAEHDPADATHVRDIVAHELVHVFHGQANSRPDFDGMDDCGWFVEGLAVYVSGQLERSHRGAAAEAIRAGKAPAHLADAWSGRYRYGVAGSMVAFVDHKYGRAVLDRMLAVTTNAEALALMKTNEGDFLAAWKAGVTAAP
jgi:hypothetical protein